MCFPRGCGGTRWKILRRAAALRGRHGGLRLGASLGAGHRALGHETRLFPAAYVKPFVKRNKTDARDAEAICEAALRPSMRFVVVESVEQQSARALQRARDLLVRQRTQLCNCLRGLLAETGVAAAQGTAGLAALVLLVEDGRRAWPSSHRPPRRRASFGPC